VVEFESMVAIDITGSMESVGNNVVGSQYTKSMVILSNIQGWNAWASQFDSTYASGGKVGADVRLQSPKAAHPDF
jgi:hypothetical protein